MERQGLNGIQHIPSSETVCNTRNEHYHTNGIRSMWHSYSNEFILRFWSTKIVVFGWASRSIQTCSDITVRNLTINGAYDGSRTKIQVMFMLAYCAVTYFKPDVETYDTTPSMNSAAKMYENPATCRVTIIQNLLIGDT
jgi:hypothetical protein